MFLNSVHFIKEKAFTQSFCEDIMKIGGQKKLEFAKVADGNQVNRKSYISWIDDKKLSTQIFEVIKSIGGINTIIRKIIVVGDDGIEPPTSTL